MPLKKKKKAAKRKAAPKRKAVKKPVKKAAKKAVAARKPAKKAVLKKRAKAKKKPARPIVPKEPVIGIITHYFPKVQAAVLKLKLPLAINDSIKVKGHTTDFTQAVSSMQIDRTPITLGKKGDEIGLLVTSRVRRRDVVYKI